MTGITTYAYLYLHGENRLQYYARLRDEAALRQFVNDTLEGALLYSGYQPPEHAVLTNLSILAAASEGVVLCPVTEGLIQRHEMVNEPLSNKDEGHFFSLNGAPLGETISKHKSVTELAYEDQPPEMQLTPAFQKVFQHYPKAPRCLLDLGIIHLNDFYERWEAVPVSIANSIAINHYAMVAQKASRSFPDIKKVNLLSVAEACLQVAAAFPPWVDSWACFSPYFDVRTSNVLLCHAPEGPHALAKINAVQLMGLPNLGRKSLHTLFFALIGFMDKPVALLQEDTNYSAALLEIPEQEGVRLAAPDHAQKKVCFSPSDALPPDAILGNPNLPSTLLSVVEGALIALPLACETVGIKPHDYLDAILARLKGATLEVCGKQYDVTRERIRQIEPVVAEWIAKSLPLILDKLKALCITDEIDEETEGLYRDLRAYASLQIGLTRLLNEKSDATTRDWLALLISTPQIGTIKNSKVLFMMLSISPVEGKTFPSHFGLFSHGFNRADAPEESIVLPLPLALNADDIQGFIHETLLPSLDGLDHDVARMTGQALLTRYGLPESVACLLLECVLIHWLIPNDEGKFHLPYATTEAQRERQETLELIREAKRPLHVVDDIFNIIRSEEIGHHRPQATVGNWIASLQEQMHSSDPDYPVLIGNSHIATINQLGLASENIDECAAYMESIMAQSQGREFSIRELAKALKESSIPSFNWPDAWPGRPRIITNNFAHVILINQRRPETRNLGRFVWKHGPWTDEPDTESRTQISNIYKDLLSKHRQPMRAQDLLDAANALRGRGVAFDQILDVNGIVRLEGIGKDALYWDTDLGPWPPELNRETTIKPEPWPEPEISTPAQEACKALFKARRRPISGKDLLAAAWEADETQAQYIDIDKIAQIDGLIRLQGVEHKALFWDSDLDPWDDDMQSDVTALQQRVLWWFKTHQEAITVERLTSLFQEFYDFLLPLTELEKAVLLSRHPDIEMQIGPNKRLMVYHTGEREFAS